MAGRLKVWNGSAWVYDETGGALTASAITNTPAGNIAATTVQAALNELDTEKAATGHNHSGTYEPALGNPGTNGYVLSSTTGGTRSWVASGGGDSTTTGTYASLPAASNDGNLYLPNNGLHILRDTGSAWAAWGPVFPMTVPDDSAFAWVNQGSATVSSTSGGVFLSAPTNSGDSLRIRKKSAPATPYTITAAFLVALPLGNYFGAGLTFRQSSDGKLAPFFIDGGANLYVHTASSPTAFATPYTNILPFHRGLIFLRIADDATNRICSYSVDGQNFVQVHSTTRTNYLTADEVGWFVNVNNGSLGAAATLVSWKQA